MSVTVVVPFAGDCSHRIRALRYVLARYAREFPDWRVVIGHGGSPWVKANAITPAIEATHSDLIVVADADCWSDGIASAVRAVICGAAEWAMPHRMVHRLTEGATAAFFDGQTLDEYTRRPYEGKDAGGILVAPRETLLATPPDPRFVGWGQEDESWGLALTTLHGECWRGDHTLTHLWHPPAPKLSSGPRGNWGSMESRRLFKRYRHASGSPDAMAQLIGEFRDLDTSHNSLHAAAA